MQTHAQAPTRTDTEDVTLHYVTFEVIYSGLSKTAKPLNGVL